MQSQILSTHKHLLSTQFTKQNLFIDSQANRISWSTTLSTSFEIHSPVPLKHARPFSWMFPSSSALREIYIASRLATTGPFKWRCYPLVILVCGCCADKFFMLVTPWKTCLLVLTLHEVSFLSFDHVRLVSMALFHISLNTGILLSYV